MNLCSHQVCNRPVYSRRSEFVVGRRWRSHATSRARSVSGRCLSSTVSTSRTASRTTGSQGNKCLTFWRWRTTYAHLLRDPDATADLPPHCPLFALQLLDLTHSGLNPKAPSSRRTATCIGIKLHSARYPDPAPFQLPDPRQPALSLTSSRLLPLLWAGANLATYHLCTRLRLCTKFRSENTSFWIQ